MRKGDFFQIHAQEHTGLYSGRRYPLIRIPEKELTTQLGAVLIE